MRNSIMILLGIVMLAFVSFGQTKVKTHLPATQKTSALAEWEGLRFGAFVHFNDNSCLVREFSKNTDPAIFNPVNLDFDALMTTFQKAGVKYAVLTTRHTSGFCLWNSKMTEFDVANSDSIIKLGKLIWEKM
jgi:alpha-L-fucosidase